MPDSVINAAAESFLREYTSLCMKHNMSIGSSGEEIQLWSGPIGTVQVPVALDAEHGPPGFQRAAQTIVYEVAAKEVLSAMKHAADQARGAKQEDS